MGKLQDVVLTVVGILVALVAYGVFINILSGSSVLGNASLGSFAGVTALLGLMPLVMVGGLIGYGASWLIGRFRN